MGTRKTRCLPACLKKVQRRFERWRRTRKVPSRIPGSLWASAARIASTYGLSRTAKALRVNYQVLKQRVNENTAASGAGLENGRDFGRNVGRTWAFAGGSRGLGA